MIKNFSSWNLHWNDIQLLISKIPGNRKKHIFIQCRRPSELINELKTLTEYDSIFLEEGDVWRYGQDPTLINFFKEQPQKFYILTLGYQHKKICDNAYELAVNTWAPKVHSTLELKSPTQTINYGCLNRTVKFHRTWLGLKLWQNNLLDKMIYSLHSVEENTSYLKNKLEAEPNWTEFLKQIPIKHLSDDGKYNDHSIEHPAYDTLCNIVTESETEYFGFSDTWPTPVVTEKTWKPFLSCQLPIFLAPQGHLEYVKSFGFDVFEDILPPNYDYMNTFDKVDAIVDIVANCPIKDIYFSNIDRIKANHALINSRKIEKQILDEVLDFVYNN